MHDSPTTTPPSGEQDREQEMELLITRMIDGEASEAERQEFDQNAAAEPTLWRQLALRQRDFILLREGFEDRTAAACRVDLRRPWLAPARMTWPLVLSGWAAVLIIGLSWALLVVADGRPGRTNTVQPALDSPEVGYETYRSAPYVLGEWQPSVLEVEQLSDGRVVVRFLRRIEEVAFLDPNRALPVDANGELTADLELLRSSEPHVGLSN